MKSKHGSGSIVKSSGKAQKSPRESTGPRRKLVKSNSSKGNYDLKFSFKIQGEDKITFKCSFADSGIEGVVSGSQCFEAAVGFCAHVQRQ